jgi:hypothetical protein
MTRHCMTGSQSGHSRGSTNSSWRSSELVSGRLYVNDTISKRGRRR